MKYMLKVARLSFPNIWKPTAFDDKPDDLTFNCNGLIEHSDPQVPQIEALIEQVAKDAWKDNWQGMLASARAQDRVPLHNGDMKADYDGYPGHYYFSARNAARPLILQQVPWQVDNEGKPLRDQKGKLIPNEHKEADGRPYGGCYVNISVEIFAYSRPKPGISAALKGIQFVKDGDSFAGGPPASPEDFGDESGTAAAGSDLSAMM